MRARLRRRTADVLDDNEVTVLLFPTVPVTAPLVGADDLVSLNDREVPTFSTIARHTAPGSPPAHRRLLFRYRRPAPMSGFPWRAASSTIENTRPHRDDR